jgi:hypothetical protein
MVMALMALGVLVPVGTNDCCSLEVLFWKSMTGLRELTFDEMTMTTLVFQEQVFSNTGADDTTSR